MMIFKIHQLNTIDFNLDLLAKQLTPFKKIIHHNSSIGFYTNSNNAELLMEAQYIMAPGIALNDPNRDTILSILDKTKPIKVFNDYDVINQDQSGEWLISIMVKRK